MALLLRLTIASACIFVGQGAEQYLQTHRPALSQASHRKTAAMVAPTGSVGMPQKVRAARSPSDATAKGSLFRQDGTVSSLTQGNARSAARSGNPVPSVSSMRSDRSSASVEDRSLATLTALSIVSSFIVIFAPAGSIWRIINSEANAGEAVGLSIPYFLLFAQSYFWALYGIEVSNSEISDVNVLGSVVCLLYLVALGCYVKTGSKKSDLEPLRHQDSMYRSNDKTQNRLAVSVFIIATVSVMALKIPDNELRSEVLAYTALTFNIMVYLAPMGQALSALRTGSIVGFPIALTIAGFVSCGLWAQYSALTHNIPYLVPNAAGLIFNGIQIAIISWVYITSEPQEEDTPEEEEDVTMPSAQKLRDQRAAVLYGTQRPCQEWRQSGLEEDEDDCVLPLLRHNSKEPLGPVEGVKEPVLVPAMAGAPRCRE